MTSPDNPQQATWTSVDDYAERLFQLEDAALRRAREASDAAGLPAIAVTAAQGQLLHLVAAIRGARAILEIGTLGGYSTIWLARALPRGGRVVTLECDTYHATVARANIRDAGLDAVVDVRVGAALELLPALEAERGDPFDMIFIDADKESAPLYVEWAVRLSRRGAVIIMDNAVRNGLIADALSCDARVQGMREALRMVANHPALRATLVQTVGAKGYDGFAMAVVEPG